MTLLLSRVPAGTEFALCKSFNCSFLLFLIAMYYHFQYRMFSSHGAKKVSEINTTSFRWCAYFTVTFVRWCCVTSAQLVRSGFPLITQRTISVLHNALYKLGLFARLTVMWASPPIWPTWLWNKCQEDRAMINPLRRDGSTLKIIRIALHWCLRDFFSFSVQNIVISSRRER